jgi:hypothetical protein
VLTVVVVVVVEAAAAAVAAAAVEQTRNFLPADLQLRRRLGQVEQHWSVELQTDFLR